MNSRDSNLNHLTISHRKQRCDPKRCRAVLGELLIQTWNTGKHSINLEWAVAKARVDNPDDHAGSCGRWGPDVEGDANYNESPMLR